jgi:hypothetical protein
MGAVIKKCQKMALFRAMIYNAWVFISMPLYFYLALN